MIQHEVDTAALCGWLVTLCLVHWVFHLQVLSVLVVAEHSLGIWGLLLAVPLTVFALDYCIRYALTRLLLQCMLDQTLCILKAACSVMSS
jgi:hypothetical protein